MLFEFLKLYLVLLLPLILELNTNLFVVIQIKLQMIKNSKVKQRKKQPHKVTHAHKHQNTRGRKQEWLQLLDNIINLYGIHGHKYTHPHSLTPIYTVPHTHFQKQQCCLGKYLTLSSGSSNWCKEAVFRSCVDGSYSTTDSWKTDISPWWNIILIKDHLDETSCWSKTILMKHDPDDRPP